MIKIHLAEISELARYPARASIPKIINKKVITYKNFDIPKKEGIYFIFNLWGSGEGAAGSPQPFRVGMKA